MTQKLTLKEDAKRHQKEEQEQLKHLWDEIRQEELAKLEIERKKRESLKKELEEQVLLAKRNLAERSRQEKELDRIYTCMAAKELAKEKLDIKKSATALRQEMLAYLKYLEELREEEARRNLEVDAIIEQSLKDEQTRRDLAVKKFKETRECNLKEVLLGREEQMRQKREEEERQQRLLEEEKAMLEKQFELDAKLTMEEKKKRKDEKLCYGKDLKEQMKDMEMKKHRVAKINDEICRDRPEKEDEYLKLINELINASETISPHPFKIVLEQYAARHTAENKGQFYCPPPLSLDQ